ncbi:GNAT family N-acetyltransferase [Anaeromicropila herbilytica]|uniref:N-acetyltransferase n=1 Tax=Anaeromicropila herbilytica TaxID=2785025 RepID=A0A7R7EJR6_9FIRM|nr:GNAT family N-acetyltransferase [Anaeromicropila herbilytica]BCN30075.1 N-acetyltransferase [Anaeromicropila herbilytica]
MIYYKDETITIRSMHHNDPHIIYHEYVEQGWHPAIEIYENYYKEQERGKRGIFIAEYNHNVAGYTTLVYEATTGPFAHRGIPEIVDFNVFVKYQRKGIGSRILDIAEEAAYEISNTISISVGLHSGYGEAQRIYIKRGYIPDGTGVWYRDRQLEQYGNCCNDDELLLYLSKTLYR